MSDEDEDMGLHHYCEEHLPREVLPESNKQARPPPPPPSPCLDLPPRLTRHCTQHGELVNVVAPFQHQALPHSASHSALSRLMPPFPRIVRGA